jgi:hypothetical protein
MLADGRSMLLMAILPTLLVCTILVATVLDRRGYLGPSFRVVGVVLPLAAIAASLSLGTAAIFFFHAADAFAQDRGLGVFAIGAGMFYLTWAQLYVVARAAWAALIGAVGTVLLMVGSVVFDFVGLHEMADSTEFLGAFQLALLLLLVPLIAPSLAAVLAERELPVQRGVVLGAFGVVTVALFTCYALVGGGLPVQTAFR